MRYITDQVKIKFTENPELKAIHDSWLEKAPVMKLVVDKDLTDGAWRVIAVHPPNATGNHVRSIAGQFS